jgi:hypothetical protein
VFEGDENPRNGGDHRSGATRHKVYEALVFVDSFNYTHSVVAISCQDVRVQSWDDAEAVALRVIPSLSGSVDARWVQRNARDLLQALLWQLSRSNNEQFVNLHQILPVLAYGSTSESGYSTTPPAPIMIAATTIFISPHWSEPRQLPGGTWWCALLHLQSYLGVER